MLSALKEILPTVESRAVLYVVPLQEGKMRIADIMVLVFVGCWLLAVLVYLIRKKKNGGCLGCSGGGCGDCPKRKK